MKRIMLAVFALALVLAGSGCDDNDPVAPAEEHFEAEGLVLLSSGAELIRVFQGVVVTSVAEELEVPVGLSDHINVYFLDSDGERIDPPVHRDDHSLGWDISDESLLEVVRGEAGHEDEEWEIHLRGLAEGETEIEFQVLHVGHVDFRTPKIPVHIHGEGEDHDHDHE